MHFVIASILVFQTQTNQNETILLTDGDWWEFSETLSWHFSEIFVLNCPLDYLRQSTFCVNFAKKQLPRRSSCIYVREVVDSYLIPLSDSEKMTYENPITHKKNYLDISSEQAVVVLDILFTVSVCLSPISRIPIFLKIWGHISWNMRGLKSSIRFNSVKLWYPFNLESSLAAFCKYKLIKRLHLYFFPLVLNTNRTKCFFTGT